jgi:hypothetical protein
MQKQKLSVGLYHVKWGADKLPPMLSYGINGGKSESLIEITEDFFPVRWVASTGKTAPDVDRASAGMNWEVVEEIKPVEAKDLPLFVSWKTGRVYERLLKRMG